MVLLITSESKMRHLIVWGVATVAILGFTLASQAKGQTVFQTKKPVVESSKEPSKPAKNEDEWFIRDNFDDVFRVSAERICHNNVVYLMVVGGNSLAVTPELSVSGKPNTCRSNPREE